MLDFIRTHGKALDLSGALWFLILGFVVLMAGHLYLFVGFLVGAAAFCSSLVCSIRRENGADTSTAYSLTAILAALALAIFIAELFA